MLLKVIKAQYLGEYKISLQFNDGRAGVVDLKDELWGTVFEPLKEQSQFSNFILDNWTICWENGADFAPEFLYDLIEKRKFAEQEIR